MHVAVVGISTDLLLSLMEFQGGTIHKAYTKYDELRPREIYLVIEHPDIPEVDEYKPLPQIMISLHTTCGENGVPIKISRMDPPKQNDGKNKIL